MTTDVRLCVTVDYDAGFVLSERPPLPDVQPGETYDDEVFPQRAIRVREVLIAEGFALFSITTQLGCISPGIPVDEGGRKLYHFGGIEVAVGTSTRLVVKNVSDRPRKVKSTAIVELLTARPRASDWIIRDIKISNRCGFCGEEFDAYAKHVCSKAAIDPVRGTMLTTVEPPKLPPDPSVHYPTIARTLMSGPGNKTLVRGCACGTAVMTPEAYATHVGWPVEAVRAVLALYGIADDLVRYEDTGDTRDTILDHLMPLLTVHREVPK